MFKPLRSKKDHFNISSEILLPLEVTTPFSLQAWNCFYIFTYFSSPHAHEPSQWSTVNPMNVLMVNASGHAIMYQWKQYTG